MPFVKKEKLKETIEAGFASSEYRPWRSIKMVEPICADCQEVAGGAPLGWWMKCVHNPYYTIEDVPVKTPIIEEVADEATGVVEKLITGSKTKLVRKESPNLKQVAFETRINSGEGVKMAQDNGCILPEAIGYKPYCQFGDCWNQNLRVRSPQFGDYCSELHCKVVIADSTGMALEVLDVKAREEQLRSIVI